MATQPLTPAHRRYLRLLGFAQPPTGLAGLQALVRAQLHHVPFENVSKLLLFNREGRGRPVRLDEFLDNIERLDLGGTCYSSNPFFAELLRGIGYQADLLGADMSLPDVHTSIRVVVDGAAYHVDVGYGGPFREPIRLDQLPHIVTEGGDRYVLAPDRRPGAFRLSMTTTDGRQHGYVVHPPPRPLAFFERTIVHSFRPGATFMRCLRMSRCFDGSTIDLRNRRFTISRADGASHRTLEDLEDLREAVDRELHMPRCPIEEAVRILERLNGKPFFGAEPWEDSI